MTAIAIIQARMSSSRLPGKVLLPLAGHPMLWHIVERARACQRVDEVVVATSVEESDNSLVSFCEEAEFTCYRGSLQNVLSRFINILQDGSHAYCVRITGDCPLIDPAFIDLQIAALKAQDADHIWLSAPTSVLEGQGVHSVRSLREVYERSNHPDDLEHVGARYFTEYPERFRIIGLNPPRHLQEAPWRITVDESADYEVIRQLYKELWREEPIKLDSALRWMNSHPSVSGRSLTVLHSAINQELKAKHKYLAKHVNVFCDWNDPHVTVSPSLGAAAKVAFS